MIFIIRYIRKVIFDIFNCLYCNKIHERKTNKNWMQTFQGVHVLLQSRPNPLNLYKLTFWKNCMLQVCNFCNYEPPLTPILKYCAQVFNYLLQVLKIYICKDLYKEIFVCQSFICVWKKSIEDTVSCCSHSTY